MAHLWKRDADEWAVVPLAGDEQRVSEMTLVRSGGDWLLLGDRHRVNGVPIAGGGRVLRDRDEIAGLTDHPLYFSTERLAEVIAMPDLGRPAVCARCRSPIEPGSPAVACPGCGLFHHEHDGRLCWTYAAVCGSCPQPTGDVGYRWTPEGLVG